MIVEISVIAFASESQSKFVAEVLKVLKEKNLKFELNPMGTVIEIEDFSILSDILKEIVDRLEKMGVPRIYINVKIDWRKKRRSMEEKVKSVLEKVNA